ncbi:hypothetical protein CHS0354_029444, partial [Potamilus streckersoni]
MPCWDVEFRFMHVGSQLYDASVLKVDAVYNTKLSYQERYVFLHSVCDGADVFSRCSLKHFHGHVSVVVTYVINHNRDLRCFILRTYFEVARSEAHSVGTAADHYLISTLKSN